MAMNMKILIANDDEIDDENNVNRIRMEVVLNSAAAIYVALL